MSAFVRDELVLPQLVHARAQSTQGSQPFLAEVGGEWRSYSEVDQAAREWVKAMQQLGVKTGSRVAVMLPTSIESMLLWLACGWLRAFEVPIHAQYRGAILRYLLDNSGAEVLVIGDQYLEALQDVANDLKTVVSIVVVPRAIPSWRDAVPTRWQSNTHTIDELRCGEFVADSGPSYSDIGAIVYTSGTTGPAKGVQVPWRLFHRHGEITIPLHDIGPRDAFYCPLPLSHIAGRVGIYNMALAGGRALLREKFSVEAFWDDIEAHHCTTAIVMGSMAEMLWRRPPSERDALTPLSKILMGPLIPQVEDFKKRFNLRVRTQFGMTETVAPLMSGVKDAWDLANTQSCGRVARGFQVRIADEHDEPVAPGEVGELLIRSDDPWLITSGYWQDAESTVRAFRNQWFHTGDAFRCDEQGNYYFVDRIKDTIRRRGENISSFFVEHAITEHPAVAECAVVGIESAFTEQEIYGFVVPKAGMQVDSVQLRDFLKNRLPAFMIPQHWICIAELPRTSTQRVRKIELRQQVLASRKI